MRAIFVIGLPGFGLLRVQSRNSYEANSGVMWEATKDTQKITYSCSDEYGSGINAPNYDVMYAMAKARQRQEQRSSEI